MKLQYLWDCRASLVLCWPSKRMTYYFNINIAYLFLIYLLYIFCYAFELKKLKASGMCKNECLTILSSLMSVCCQYDRKTLDRNKI